MPLLDPALWSEHLQRNLELYEEPLLRQVAARLIKPRNQWPADDLIKRMVEAAGNAAIVDRRLREAVPAGRQLLAMIDHSRRPCWHAGQLIELLAALGSDDPLAVLLSLLENGLLYLELAGIASPVHEHAPKYISRAPQRCKAFTDWFTQATAGRLLICAHPSVSRRAATERLPLPDLSRAASGRGEPSANGQGVQRVDEAATVVREADGLEWLLRLAIVWQQVRAAPLRRTQQGDFFKRDQDRLRSDALLASQPADALMELPDPGLLAVSLALKQALLGEADGQLTASAFPRSWHDGLADALLGQWLALLEMDTWNASDGWGSARTANPYPTAYLLALLLLGQVPPGRWCRAEAVVRWVEDHHPYVRPAQGRPRKKGDDFSAALRGFLLGLAYPMRLIQAIADGDGSWLVRLSRLGRWLLGQAEAPPLPCFPQTLLVQPNLEILVYRQGLTPDLLTRLTRFARWRTLGAACSMQLEPETVYAALEAEESFESILHTLQCYGIKPPPPAVIDSLRTWSQKRERITVYPVALILEFLNAGDLDAALARGVPAVRLGPQLAVLPQETDIDYRHFRLISNRDYTLPPERCVIVGEDGVTLSVDWNHSDLLLESELGRFAAEAETEGSVRVFRLTPASVRRGRELGLTLEDLQGWFLCRCDQPLTAAARLLFSGPDTASAVSRLLSVVQVADFEVADGLLQWPATRGLVHERLGPTALVIAAENLPLLAERLKELGIRLMDSP
jgi:hypothetical protein